MKRPWLFTPPTNEGEIFKFVQFELWFLGCWAYPTSNKFITYSRGVFQILVNFISVIPQYIFAYESRKNLVLVLECMCPATTMAVTVYKQSMLLWRTNELNDIFNEIKGAITHEIIQKGVWIRKWIPVTGFYFAMFLTCTTLGTGTSFDIMPVISNIQRMLQGQVYFDVVLPFKSSWPFDYKISPNYEIMYIFYVYAAFITEIGIPATDALFLDIYLHIGMLFKSVANDILNVTQSNEVNNEGYKPFTYAENKKIYKELIKIMRKHQYCFDLCERVRVFFAEILFIHFTSASLIICLSSIDLLLAPGIHKLIFVNYIIAATTQVFVYSKAGGYLDETSVSVSMAVYNCPWYKMNASTRQLLLMIIRRSNKPVIINVPLVTASLPTFMSICQAAGSYVTLLQTFL